MNKTMLALALIGFTSAAAVAQPLRLSEIPPGAIHTPGIGPGYVYPTQDTETAMGAGTMPATSMMPGAAPMVIEHDTGMGQAWAMERLRVQGFNNVTDLRQAPDGSWHGLVMQRGGVARVRVGTDGSVGLRQQ